MQTAEECKSPETIQIGPDRVEIIGGQVVINARHAMPDWQVREFVRVPIYFRDKKYFLRQKFTGEKPYAMRYVLDLWPAESQEMPRSTLDYNEEVVAQREAAIRGGHYEDIGRAVLLMVYPFLGLFWSGTKDRLARFGILSRSVTGVSIMLTFCLLLLDGIFAKVLMMSSLKTGQLALGGILRTFASRDYLDLGLFEVRFLWLDCALFVLLLLDLLIRYSQHLRDDELNLGFLEWLFRFRKKSPGELMAASRLN